jgi:hypothetical protein
MEFAQFESVLAKAKAYDELQAKYDALKVKCDEQLTTIKSIVSLASFHDEPTEAPADQLAPEQSGAKWNECILSVCRDGTHRSSDEIYEVIKSMDKQPWDPSAKTPSSTCGTMCLRLWEKGKLERQSGSPIVYW